MGDRARRARRPGLVRLPVAALLRARAVPAARRRAVVRRGPACRRRAGCRLGRGRVGGSAGARTGSRPRGSAQRSRLSRRRTWRTPARRSPTCRWRSRRRSHSRSPSPGGSSSRESPPVSRRARSTRASCWRPLCSSPAGGSGGGSAERRGSARSPSPSRARSCSSTPAARSTTRSASSGSRARAGSASRTTRRRRSRSSTGSGRQRPHRPARGRRLGRGALAAPPCRPRAPRWVGVYAASLLPLEAHFDRYVLPLVAPLGVLAGRVRVLAPAALILLAVPLAWTLADNAELRRTDTREVAQPGSALVPAGEMVATDPSTPPLDGRRSVGLPLPRPADGSDPTRPTWTRSGGGRALGARHRRGRGPCPRGSRPLPGRGGVPRRAAATRAASAVRRRAVRHRGSRARGSRSTVCSLAAMSVEPAVRPESEELPLRPTPAPDLGPAVGTRHALAVGFAVFVSGRRPARARDRREPSRRALLRQFALRLGRADRRRPRRALDRLLAPAARSPTGCPRPGCCSPRCRRARCSCSLIPFVDEPILEWVVTWDPGPRLNPLIAAIALFGIPSVVFATVTPIAVRLLAPVGASASGGRRGASSPSRPPAASRARSRRPSSSSRSSARSSCSGQAAAVLLAGVALVALVERMPVAFAAALAATVGAAAASASLAPEQGGRLEGAAAQNWSPIYRERRAGGRRGRRSRRRRLRRRLPQGHAVPRPRGGRRRGLALPALRQLLPERDVSARPFATRFEYIDFFNLGLAYNPDARRVLFVGLGGGSAPKRLWRDFPQLDLQVVELDPVVRGRGVPVLPAAAQPAPPRRGRGRAPLPRPERRALGSDRDRRVLRRLDPVPPDDGRVHRAACSRGSRPAASSSRT